MTTPCKVCGHPASPCAEVDFARSCGDADGPVFPPDGRAVIYLRCARCGLVFTRFFDGYTHDDLRREIYNDDYAKADPFYASSRPAANAATLRAVLREACDWGHRPSLLDWGAGSGAMVATLLDVADARGWDPFSQPAPPPDAVFDVVFCSEVLEHVPDPMASLRAIAARLRPGGFALLSTALVPARAPVADWWYLAPRNGHITLYTAEALRRASEEVGLQYTALSDAWHLAERRDAPCDALHRPRLRAIVDALPTGFVSVRAP
ncbi:MAG: class I SAM-dependent methyltransferase [Polyangiales bacterium]